MSEVSIAAILRGVAFSPNNVGSDSAILNAVAAGLRRRGFPVNIYSEEQFIAHGIGPEPIVITMARDSRSLSRLHQLESEGRKVINSGYGILHCTRGNMLRIFDREGIPHPTTVLTSTDVDIRPQLNAMGFGRCWVKRADCQTIHKEDVACARHIQEAQELLNEFFIRGIQQAVIVKNAEGTHLKFYGVADTDFFHCFFTHDHQVPTFDTGAFRAVCSSAATALGVQIYGGDAMVDPTTGEFTIVSFDDWPGFAPCRDTAAKAIIKLVGFHARKLMKR